VNHPTRVISVRGRDREELLCDPDFVYVGRTNRRTGWIGRGWGNPWTARDFEGGLAACVEYFEEGLNAAIAFVHDQRRDVVISPGDPVRINRIGDMDAADWMALVFMARHLPDLKGKTLGCWCCDHDGTGTPSRPCHAVVIARLADSLPLAEVLAP